MLEDKQIQTMKLINRSPDRGEGWRSVTKVCWPLLKNVPTELIEREQAEDGSGRVRFTEKGQVIVEFAL